MPRFFVSAAPAVGESFVIGGEDARHISLSLRMAAGDPVTVSDGAGLTFSCVLERLTPEAVTARALAVREGEGELPVSVILYQACPKGDKLELIVQKATELGATGILPFISQRCISRPKGDKTARLAERLARIAREAAGQSGRSRLPWVGAPVDFPAALAHARENCDAILFCYEAERGDTLRAALTAARAAGHTRLGLFVGSEGGFSPAEVEEAVAAGARPVGLGDRILRCETAPLAALACIGYEWGE